MLFDCSIDFAAFGEKRIPWVEVCWYGGVGVRRGVLSVVGIMLKIIKYE